MGATLSYADHLVAQNPADQTPQELADLYCSDARRRIEANFKAVKSNFNRLYDKVSGLLMDGKLDWLAAGAINPIPPQYRDWEKNDYEHPAREVYAEAPAQKPESPKVAA